MIYSPLRYPGGKAKIAKFVKLNIENLNIENCTYIEPFAGGGAGVALFLLFEGIVDRIVINDLDKAIYSFWRAVLKDTNKLINLIMNTPVTIDEWQKQREIYLSEKKYSVELAFATFFLNRTNRSGIIKGGPIGGFSQLGEWKLDARYNKEELIGRIIKISMRKNQIKIYNKDILSFVDKVIPKHQESGFVYLDPPYFNKGKELYTNFFNENDHRRIADSISKNIACNWIVTYDNTPEIIHLYQGHTIKKYDLNYSLAKKGIASELIIFKTLESCPSESALRENKVEINLR